MQQPFRTSIAYGGDYNPDQWSEAVWHEDMVLMREAGVNLVSLGIFSWAKLEPTPGQFDFEWLDRVLDLLYTNGVQVDLATPTASPPAWLVRLHPEMLPMTADGVTLWHGARRHYCPNNPAYHDYAARIVTELAQHVAGHPALAMWHIDNEYACHVSECFCDISAEAFRQWLAARYEDLDVLNSAWGTAFWSQHYSDWQEIYPPRRAPTFGNPAQALDWLRFCSDSFLLCFEQQRAILRDLTPHIPLTTNFMRFFKPLDYWKWAAREDLVSNDNYPDPSEPAWMIESAMSCDLMRSLKHGEPWLLMEQAPTNVNWRQRNATKPPGVMRLGSYQAVARGANGVMFFQWRASRAGAEKFHSGMVPHVGTDSRVWREVKGLGQELRGLDALLPSRVHAEVAIVFDWDNWWALELPSKPSNDVKLFEQVKNIYTELYRRNVTVDFVRAEDDLTKYKLVLAPNLYLVSDDAAQNIEKFVRQGGALLMTFFSGIVEENDRVRLGGYPAQFRDLLGLWIEEFAPLAEGQTSGIVAHDGQRFGCQLWGEVVHAAGAEVLATFAEDYYAGCPAVTRNMYGNGTSFYVGTELVTDGLAWLLDEVLAAAQVQHAPNTTGVEMIKRSEGAQAWLFALNYSDQPLQVGLDAPGFDLIRGARVEGTLSLGAKDVAIVQLG